MIFAPIALPRVDFRLHVAVEAHPCRHVADGTILVELPLLKISAVAGHCVHPTGGVAIEAESRRSVGKAARFCGENGRSEEQKGGGQVELHDCFF